MSTLRLHARNLMSSWTSQLANLVILYFLTPFVVSTLGDETYGVWNILVSVTGYLGLVEIGVRVSTGRFVSYHCGRNEPEEVSRVVNTSLAFYAGVSVMVLLAGGVLGAFFGDIFSKIPASLIAEAPWAIILLALNIWMGLFSSTFSQILYAADRIDLANVVALTTLAVRTAGTVWVLNVGGGLIGLAAVQVASGAAACLLLAVLARWKGVAVSYGIRYVNMVTLKRVFGFGLWAFVGNFGSRIINYSGAAIVGYLIGAREVTLFSIGLMIADYGTMFASEATNVLGPTIVRASGRQDLEELRWLVIRGAQVTTFLATPILVGFIVLGREFVGIWQGPERIEAASVLVILALANAWPLAARSAGSCLWGLGHVRWLSMLRGIQALATLVLSVTFMQVFGWGISGMALGTLLPMTVCDGILVTSHACRTIHLPMSQFLRQAVLPWVVSGLVYAGMCWVVQQWIPPSDSWAFWIKVLILVPLYLPVGVTFILGWSRFGQLVHQLFLPVRGAFALVWSKLR